MRRLSSLALVMLFALGTRAFADQRVTAGLIEVTDSDGSYQDVQAMWVEQTDTDFTFEEYFWGEDYSFKVSDGDLMNADGSRAGRVSADAFEFTFPYPAQGDNPACTAHFKVTQRQSNPVYWNDYTCEDGYEDHVKGTLFAYAYPDGDSKGAKLKRKKALRRRHR